MEIKDIDRVYVVNLDRRSDRYTAIQAAWAATGVDLPLTRWTACDGDIFDPPRSWDVGRGAFGCYLSHVSILVEQVRMGLENVLVLEDDATFAPDFAEKLKAVLNDLPTLYDQLYLGYQLLHTDRLKPSRITENLGRASNCNRNHAILYSRRGAVRLLAHLLDLSERQKKEHIDHWLGRAIHEATGNDGQHLYDIYISIPPIVYQGGGKSDINGKNNPEHKWLYSGDYIIEPPELADVVEYKSGYGTIGKGNSMGFDGLTVTLPPGCPQSTISLHAPSTATIRTREPLLVMGYMNKSGGPGEPVEVFVDGRAIGSIQKKKSQTPAVRIAPGEHRLEFRIDDKYKGLAHSVWVFGRV